ncbi:hypothetical protein D3C73_1584830 [compost metagenome]
MVAPTFRPVGGAGKGGLLAEIFVPPLLFRLIVRLCLVSDWATIRSSFSSSTFI